VHRDEDGETVAKPSAPVAHEEPLEPSVPGRPLFVTGEHHTEEDSEITAETQPGTGLGAAFWAVMVGAGLGVVAFLVIYLAVRLSVGH
jgi:hypothetical protein